MTNYGVTLLPSEHLADVPAPCLPLAGAEKAVDEVVGQVTKLAHLQVDEADFHWSFNAVCVLFVLVALQELGCHARRLEAEGRPKPDQSRGKWGEGGGRADRPEQLNRLLEEVHR